jgi:hypothetical protein
MSKLTAFSIIGVLSLTSPALRAATIESEPVKVISAYVEFLKAGDIQKAVSLTAQFPKLGPDHIKQMTQEAAAALKVEPVTVLSEQTKILEDCAVVIGKQSETDLDPLYLLKQAGQWRVLPTVTDIDHPALDLSDAQRTRFQELRTWFKRKKAENYERLSK